MIDTTKLLKLAVKIKTERGGNFYEQNYCT